MFLKNLKLLTWQSERSFKITTRIKNYKINTKENKKLEQKVIKEKITGIPAQKLT